MKYNVALFDLDGTIIDSSLGITSAVMYALDKKGYKCEGRESLRHFIGPPLREEFMKYCGVDIDEGTSLVETYREYYSAKGIYECSVYDGVAELLKSLKNADFKVVLATSKPEKFARMILEHVGLSKMFDFAGGANFDNTRTDKASVIKYCFDSTGLWGLKDKAVMIGDCGQEVVGAAAVGIDSIAVSYGFGILSDLEKSSPTHICHSPREIEEWLLN